MGIEIREYIDVFEKSEALECEMPEGYAFLPRNFASAENREELVHESSTASIRKVFSNNGLMETKLEKNGERLGSVLERSYDFIPPTLFVSLSLYSLNPELVSIACDLIAAHIHDFFKGKGKVAVNPTTKFKIVLEKTSKKDFREITYEGDVEGIKALPKVVEQVFKNNEN
jgi:hypothetical protein